MDNVVIASTEADAQAIEAVERHHAELAGSLRTQVARLTDAAAAGDTAAAEQARHQLVGWLERELVPHALAEETSMYPAAHATAEVRLLVDGMLV
jgi:hypothetical protein